MDDEWALAELRAFIEMTTLVTPQSPPGVYGSFPARPKGGSKIPAAAQVVEQILVRVIPHWRTDIAEDESGRWRQHREAAQRAVVQIERLDELRERLGDDAPHLDAAQMHPWAWEGARSLWQSGHYREAVRAAATKVNAETQNKLGIRDISETALFQMAFSADEPAPGKPRLRPGGDDGGKTALSMRRGVMAFAEGCFAAIRNPASHDVLDELEEGRALEQLAAISVLARWVDESSVTT